MQIFIASDSFKGCMTSMEANRRIEAGLKKAGPIQCDIFPISDGGEGMTEAYAAAAGLPLTRMHTVDLYGKRISVPVCLDKDGKRACIDAASMLGVTLYPRGQRRPLHASSYGLGLLLRKLISQGYQEIVVGLGGTGTNDGGMGLLQAFGALFCDSRRQPLSAGASSLENIAFIDKRNVYLNKNVKIIAACDVTNPLLGPDGATRTFGAQKGLKPLQMERVEKGMTQLAAKISQTFHADMIHPEGSGAAGGLGGMLLSVFHAQMMPGLDVLQMFSPLQQRIAKADLVITGEGQTDGQSAKGKVVSSLCRIASQTGTPVICLSGALGPGWEKMYNQGICAMFSTADHAMSFPQALRQGPEKLEQTAENVGRLILAMAAEKKTGKI